MKKFFAWSLCGAVAALLLALACTGAQSTSATTADTPKPSQQPVNKPPDTLKPPQQPVIKPPVISDIVGPGLSAPHSDVQLTCMAKDNNGGTLTYAWAVDNGVIRDEGKQATSFAPVPTDKKDEEGNPMVGFNTAAGVPIGSIVTWTTPDAVGTYTVTVKASSSKGGEATFSKSFGVVEPSTSTKTVPGVPSADTTIYLRFDMSSGSAVKESRQIVIMVPQAIQCEVLGQDLSGLTFKWSVPLGGKLIGDGIAEGRASSVGWVTPGVPGQYSVNVVISDKSGHEVRGQVDFDVAAM